MKIEAIRIQSFKSFFDSSWIELSPNFTILVGQNNAGKSAFLQAFDVHSFQAKAHRTPKHPEGTGLARSVVVFKVRVEGEEIRQRALNEVTFYLPTTQGVRERAEAMFFATERIVEIAMHDSADISIPSAPNYGLFPDNQLMNLKLDVDIFRREITQRSVINYANGPIDNVVGTLISILRENTFLFKAERYAVGQCSVQSETRLRPDASNLPYMLLLLNRQHRKMEEFQSLVSEVLPGIKRVLISALGEQIEISAQSHENMRGDLAIPLNECGTGVAQVLAILYVVIAFPSALLVIDEPNSFLHPGATRRLLNVLRRYNRHQYILSTHSAEVISAVQPDKLLLLRWDEEDGETKVFTNSSKDIEHIRASLTELGVGLSDVFGFDVVAFVEGPTEVECFPFLLEDDALANLNFVAMREASALTVAKPEALFDIYTKGVSGSALIPPKVRFSFDPDGRTLTEQEDIIRKSRRTARFLKRPMYENYLLHPDALSARLQSLDGIRPETGPEAIDAWIKSNYLNFTVKRLENRSPETCDAAKLLAKMFSELTEVRHQYNKIEDGKALTRWLLANNRDALKELKDYVLDLLK